MKLAGTTVVALAVIGPRQFFGNCSRRYWLTAPKTSECFDQRSQIMRRIFHYLLLTAVAVLLINGPVLAQTIKVPYVSISGFQAPLYLGERAGLFKKNQLDAQLIYMPGGSLIVQTLL